jgi:NTP pyrophosphatase (non-canonical NTP hydrolase)
MENDYLKIINHFGVNNQQRKLQEEVFELQEAINDYKYVEVYKGSPAEKIQKNNIAEELADCFILLKQFQRYFDFGTMELSEIMKSKLKRTLERIESGYYEANTR